MKSNALLSSHCVLLNGELFVSYIYALISGINTLEYLVPGLVFIVNRLNMGIKHFLVCSRDGGYTEKNTY